jgi:hypothetical protein
MELWQIDAVGGIGLTDGSTAKALTEGWMTTPGSASVRR